MLSPGRTPAAAPQAGSRRRALFRRKASSLFRRILRSCWTLHARYRTSSIFCASRFYNSKPSRRNPGVCCAHASRWKANEEPSISNRTADCSSARAGRYFASTTGRTARRHPTHGRLLGTQGRQHPVGCAGAHRSGARRFHRRAFGNQTLKHARRKTCGQSAPGFRCGVAAAQATAGKDCRGRRSDGREAQQAHVGFSFSRSVRPPPGTTTGNPHAHSPTTLAHQFKQLRVILPATADHCAVSASCVEKTKPPALASPKPEPKSQPARNAAAVTGGGVSARGIRSANALP